MRDLVATLALLLATTATAAQAPVRCRKDADCARLGAGYQCQGQRVACATHPESSTCEELVCSRRPGAAVKDADRACEKDSDCQVVVLRFQCMYCARPGDWMDGVVAAANKKRAKAYEVKPTKEQLRSCAEAGACAQSGREEARCLSRVCAAVYVPFAP